MQYLNIFRVKYAWIICEMIRKVPESKDKELIHHLGWLICQEKHVSIKILGV